MSDTTSRQMKVPYTFAAKIAQFPLKHYLKNQWIWKYYIIAVVCCIPVFYKIGKMSNSPENVEKWKELKRREKEEYADH